MARRLSSWFGREAERFLSMGTLETRIQGTTADNAALLKEVDATLEAGTDSLRFGAIIEERFDEAARAPREAMYLRLAVVGTVFYNLLLLVDAVIVPDVLREAVIIQLGIVTPIACACMVAIGVYRRDVNHATMITVMSMLAATVAIFLMSRSEHAGLYGCFCCLIVVSVNIAQAWSFTWALAFTIITNVVVALAVLMHPSLDMPTRVFIVTLVGSASQYSLVGNYRVNTSMRRAYLFVLRESLRVSLLAESNVRLETLATVDGLTGVGNRRHFESVLSDLWTRRGQEAPVALLLIDIDHFKRLNDTHGHQAGDACLRQVAQRLAERTARPGLTLARYGGEEFAVILAGTTPDEAATVAEDLRGAIEELPILAEDGAAPLRLTVSIGCAAIVPGPTSEPADLVAGADAALYLAKREGRNRTRSADLRQVLSAPAADRPEGAGSRVTTAA